MPSVQDWTENLVYLVQFPRSKCVPSISPFCLKLETWLRIAEIEYRNVSNKLTGKSKKGQVPFVELNGQQINDTYFVIEALTQHFRKASLESHLSSKEQATARAFEVLLEQSIAWMMIKSRQNNIQLLFHPDAIKLNGILGKLKPIVAWNFGRALKTKLFHQGIGRLTMEEAESVAKNDLKCLSEYLGTKPYFSGIKAARLDATAFGHLSQLWFLPDGMETEMKSFMGQETKNLVDFLERMKAKFWPDWSQICEARDLENEACWKTFGNSQEVVEEI